MVHNLRKRFQSFRRKRAPLERSQQLQSDLLMESTLDSSYLVLVVGSCVIATFGLLANSVAVIIGAMIIAPLMMPIRGIAFGALQGNVLLFRKGMIAITMGTLLAVVIAFCLGKMVGLPSYGSEVLARTEPTLLDLGIAVMAGGISGYAKVQPKLAGSLAGTAIAVALMPPICVIGLGLSQADWSLSWGATLLYVTNLLGITLACMLTFWVAGYVSLERARRALLWALALTSVLMVPLGIGFIRLVQQAQLEASLKQALLNRTVTFQRLGLLKIQTNWLINPPEVYLNVRAQTPITPKQVSLLQTFIEREMKQPFTLVFIVGQVQEIRADGTTMDDKNIKSAITQ